MLWDILILVKIGLVKITLLKLILLKQEAVICVINLLEEIAFERMDVRVSKYLLDISKRTNNSDYLYLTQEKIAQELGTSREVITRLLTDFKNKDIITSQRGKITIINRDKLIHLSQL